MGEFFVFEGALLLDERTKKDHFGAERNKFHTCVFNIGNSGGIAIILEKKIPTLVCFLLGFVYRNFVDGGKDVDFDEMDSWDFASFEEIFKEGEGGKFGVRHLLGFEQNIAANFDYFVNPLSMSEIVFTYLVFLPTL